MRRGRRRRWARRWAGRAPGARALSGGCWQRPRQFARDTVRETVAAASRSFARVNMPLYSEHIANMYYGGTPTYTGTPYGYSGSVSSLGTSYSAPYLNPGGSYSSHSSLGSYSRTPHTSRWITSSGRNYSPILSTISERVTSSPVRLNSPRRIPIMKRTYGTSNYTPRPININTADIDVSRNKYHSKRKSPSPVSPKTSPHKILSNAETDSSPFMPRVDGKPETGIDSSPGTQRSTIRRGRTVVRLHTIKRKERDSPRKPTDASDPEPKNANDPNIIPTSTSVTKEDSPEPTKWREKLSDDLIYKGKKIEKKSLGSKLVEKFILKDENGDVTQKSDEGKKNITTAPLPDANIVKSLDRRCSLELLAEQADLLDTLIRKENLSTATLDLSKVGILDEPKTSFGTYQCVKRRKSNETIPLKTTKSDNSLHDNLKSFKNQKDSKQFSKRRSLKKSSSGGSICRLDSITEFPKEPALMDLPAIEENRQSIKIENTKAKAKPKLKAKITSSVEVSAPTSPLKFRVDNVTVEEKPRILKKEIIYSSSVEDTHSSEPKTIPENQNKFNTSNKNEINSNVPPSPEPDDGNFWNKIGKRETIYLLKRKQNLDELKEKDRRAQFWFPGEEDSGINDEILSKSTESTRKSPELDFKISSDDDKMPISSDQYVDVVDQIDQKSDLKSTKDKNNLDENIQQNVIKTDLSQEINTQVEKHDKNVETKLLETQQLPEILGEVSIQQQNSQSLNDIHHNEPREINSKVFATNLNKNKDDTNVTIPENKSDVKNRDLNKSKDNTKYDSHRNKSEKACSDIDKSSKISSKVLETSSLKLKINSEEPKRPEEAVHNTKDQFNDINKILPMTQNNEIIISSLEDKTSTNRSETQVKPSSLDTGHAHEMKLVETPKGNNILATVPSDLKDDKSKTTLHQNKMMMILESELKTTSANTNLETKENEENLIPSNEKSDIVGGCQCGKLNMLELKEKTNFVEKHTQDESITPKFIKTKSKSVEKNKHGETDSPKLINIKSGSLEEQEQKVSKAPKLNKQKSNSVEKCGERKSSKVIKEKIESVEKEKIDKFKLPEDVKEISESIEKTKDEELNISKFVNDTSDVATKNKLHESNILKPTKQDDKMKRNMSGIKNNLDNKDKINKTFNEKNSKIVSEAKNVSNIIKNNNMELISSDSQSKSQSKNVNPNEDNSNLVCSNTPTEDINGKNETPTPLDMHSVFAKTKQSIKEKKGEVMAEVSTKEDTSDTILIQHSDIPEIQKPDNIAVQITNNSDEPLQIKPGEVYKAEQDSKVNDEQQVEVKESSTKDIIKLPQTAKKPVKEEAALRPLIATPRPLQRKVPQIIHSSSSSETSSEEDSSDDDDADESDSSEDSTEFFECENNADGRTSTGSNDSGFDSSAPTSPASFLHIKKDCDVNCHRKCEKLTANLCGVNQRLLVEALASRTSFRKGADSPGTSTGPAPTQSDSHDLSEQELEQSTAYGLFRKTGQFTPPARSIPRFRKYVIDDFHFIKVLGKGSFGKVLLAELRDTEYYYAVKCLKKDVVLEDDDVECTLIERKVLALGTNHPYLCHLFATFQTDSHLFFVMEYLNGGDLMFHIQQSGRFPENRARLYAAEIVSGLKFLHKRGIVYRDLKLDNILLDFDGHVRIADFGMCKLQIYLDKTADTFCGTPDYMAPEIIKGLKYNQTVDWWSFGVLLYEMLIGQSPFSGCDEDELFWSICNEMPSYPRFLSQQALTILTRLLDKDAKSRLGGTECMHGDIRDQDFFHSIHWEKLERRELDAPFKPRVRHPLDTQYFDRAFTGERPRLTAVEPHVLRSMDQAPFRGFSYTNPNATDR